MKIARQSDTWKVTTKLIPLLLVIVAVFVSIFVFGEPKEPPETPAVSVADIADCGEFEGEPYAVVNRNIPGFTDEEKAVRQSFEEYPNRDLMGRCKACTACIGRDIMPTEPRGSIGMVKPTGWHTVKYDWVDGKYLYNRCHLIGFQLAGENANENNLITGTRYLNVDKVTIRNTDLKFLQ